MNGNTTHDVPTAMQRSEQLLDSIAQRLHDGTLCARQLGELGEQYAAAWLESQGWQTLDRNWHCRYGELDIVSRDDAGNHRLRRSQNQADTPLRHSAGSRNVIQTDQPAPRGRAMAVGQRPSHTT